MNRPKTPHSSMPFVAQSPRQPRKPPQWKAPPTQPEKSTAQPSTRQPIAPPVYRPQARHKTLQAKEAAKPQNTPLIRAGRPWTATAATLPQPNAGVRTRLAKGAPPTPPKPNGRTPKAPAPYRATAAPAVMQRKTAGLPRHSGGKGGVMSPPFRKGGTPSAFVIQRAASASSTSTTTATAISGAAAASVAVSTTTTTATAPTITDSRSAIHKNQDQYKLSDYEVNIKSIVNLKPGAKTIKLARGWHMAFEVWAGMEVGHFNVQFDDDSTMYHVYFTPSGWYILGYGGQAHTW